MPAAESAMLTNISIHALRGEGDLEDLPMIDISKHFNPRPPWGGRLFELDLDRIIGVISIHALRGEGDF